MFQIIKVKKIIEGLVEYIGENIRTTPKEEDTFLYNTVFNTVDGNFDFYQQAKSLFLRTEENPNMIQVSLEYPKDKTSLPAYIIREPGKGEGPSNSIGKLDGIFYDNGAPQYRDTRQYNFEIMCVSVNFLESILMSEIMYALLLGSYELLADQFLTIEFNMKELMIDTSLMPTPIFVRSIGLNVSSDELVPGLIDSVLLGKIVFGKLNQQDSVLLGDSDIINGLPGVESEIKGV